MPLALPMSIALSTTHSFLPPYPGPTAVAATFHASVGLGLFYGLFCGLFIAGGVLVLEQILDALSIRPPHENGPRLP